MQSIQQQLVKQAITTLLQGVGEDPAREGLRETPERVANMYEWLLSGAGLDPASAIDTVFEAEHRDPVVLSNIPFYSLCEHHLLPFFGIAHMAYVPGSKISGLSKLARALDVAARRLQVQERLTGQVADSIASALDPDGVVVQLEAEHLCMAMRGIQKPGHRVTTTATRGRFEHFSPGRDGLLALLNRR